MAVLNDNNLDIVIGIAAVVSANFTTPAGAAGYAVDNLIANNAVAASVAPLVFAAARAPDKSGMVRRARIKTTDTGAAGKSFRLHLYKDDPSTASGIVNGDHAAWLTKEAVYIGAIDVTLDLHFTDCEKGIGVPPAASGSEINFEPSTGTANIFGLLQAKSAFTPQGGKLWTVALEVLQN